MTGGRDQGSVLLTVLVVSLGAVLLMSGMSGALLLAQAGAEAEREGRELSRRADEALAAALGHALDTWEAGRWEGPDGARVELAAAPGMPGRVMVATATVREGARTCVVSALVERGGDGFELPWAAVVATSLGRPVDRTAPLVVSEVPVEVAVDVVDPGAPLGPGVALVPRVGRALEFGAECAAEESTPSMVVAGAGEGAADALGWSGGGMLGRGAETPVLLLGGDVTPLDARRLGEVHGVVLAGLGGVDLQGTTVVGAVLAEGPVMFGDDGLVRFDVRIREWASYGSRARVRLVPGTRTEVFVR